MTNLSLKQTAKIAAFTAAFVASGTSVAMAGTTSGNNSILGGNQINAPISIPLNVCGNALALLGDAFGGCQGGAAVGGGSGGGNNMNTSGNNSIGGGNQLNAPVKVPVNVCGNSAAALGTAISACKGGAVAGGGSGSGHMTTSGNNSILGGNQINAPISIPVNICGNAAAVLGFAAAGCEGGAAVLGSGSGGATTSGNNSIGGGNQINVPISVPINVCGNSASVLGTALSGCKGGSTTGTTPPPPPPCGHKGCPPPPPPCHHRGCPPPPPPCHHNCTPPPPPCHHRTCPPPPPGHHGGTGTTTTTTALSSGSLPTTGANFLALMAIAGTAVVGGGGLVFAGRRGAFRSFSK
ncbi:MAG TPA: chaplin family protein [Streptosporangiaceae bacterium]|jgi:LPXTG-motif cell wall-anchored protein